MKSVFRISTLCIFLIFSNNAQSEKQDDVHLKSIMSSQEFNQCGLNKLSPTELNRLNTWLNKTILNMVLIYSLGDCREHSIKYVAESIIGLDDGSVWRSNDYLSYSWSSYDSVIIFNDKMINLDEEEIIDVTCISQGILSEPPSKKTSLATKYQGIGTGHWIMKIENGGRIVILEDNSIWEISAIDRIYTAIWLPITSITVVLSDYPISEYKYLLINTDDNEKASAKYLGR